VKTKRTATSTTKGHLRDRTESRHQTNAPPLKLRALAQQTERQLNIIQRGMRQRLQAEFARGHLTGPQRLVMSALVRTDGLSLKQLSEAVSLAHSTVSGIVDRLVKQGLIERKAHPTDRRITLLTASPTVRNFLTTRMPELALHPLLEALRRASPSERKSITAGLDVLARLLSPEATDADAPTFHEIEQ
jgi:DNA-binding MarR family transcriptional regulator